jgi:hypothetical protein
MCQGSIGFVASFFDSRQKSSFVFLSNLTGRRLSRYPIVRSISVSFLFASASPMQTSSMSRRRNRKILRAAREMKLCRSVATANIFDLCYGFRVQLDFRTFFVLVVRHRSTGINIGHWEQGNGFGIWVKAVFQNFNSSAIDPFSTACRCFAAKSEYCDRIGARSCP